MFISAHPNKFTKVVTISTITGFAKFYQLDWISSMKVLFKGLYYHEHNCILGLGLVLLSLYLCR